ncbi:hypothetical protein F5Y18DRAFT_75435 [Xylariaceae sp. FL1019]|nr:hypothetical protein F5Y18DRAFT_75435 [Xylariaceae sp. FL1019]
MIVKSWMKVQTVTMDNLTQPKRLRDALLALPLDNPCRRDTFKSYLSVLRKQSQITAEDLFDSINTALTDWARTEEAQSAECIIQKSLHPEQCAKISKIVCLDIGSMMKPQDDLERCMTYALSLWMASTVDKLKETKGIQLYAYCDGYSDQDRVALGAHGIQVPRKDSEQGEWVLNIGLDTLVFLPYANSRARALTSMTRPAGLICSMLNPSQELLKSNIAGEHEPSPLDQFCEEYEIVSMRVPVLSGVSLDPQTGIPRRDKAKLVATME